MKTDNLKMFIKEGADMVFRKYKGLHEPDMQTDKQKFKVVEIPIPRAKKLLKLIRQYCYREEDPQKVDKWMAQNTKLALYWGMIR